MGRYLQILKYGCGLVGIIRRLSIISATLRMTRAGTLQCGFVELREYDEARGRRSSGSPNWTAHSGERDGKHKQQLGISELPLQSSGERLPNSANPN